MNVEWRPLTETDVYEVNNLGDVRHAETKKVLAKCKDKNGYIRYCLFYDGKRHFRPAHRLVALAFIPNPDNLPMINHKDETTDNNTVENLEWCNAKYNNNYGHRPQRLSESLKGRISGMQGKHHSEKTKKLMSEWQSKHNRMRGKKLSAEAIERIRQANTGRKHYPATIAKMSQAVRCVETGKVYIGTREAEAETGVNHSGISRACRGVYETSGGLHWEYVESE